jgi:hypothetical protein
MLYLNFYVYCFKLAEAEAQALAERMQALEEIRKKMNAEREQALEEARMVWLYSSISSFLQSMGRLCHSTFHFAEI